MNKHKEIILLMLFFLAFAGCDWGIPDFNVSVTVEEGVIGAPEAGEYNHREGTKVNYEYLAEDLSHSVEVFINENRSAPSGSLTVWTSFTIVARLVDIRGTWAMKMGWTEPPEGFDFEFNITFSGADLTSGMFSDDRGFHGLWTVENGTITITYTDWNDYILIGSVFTMEGSFNGDGSGGTWEATKPE